MDIKELIDTLSSTGYETFDDDEADIFLYIYQQTKDKTAEEIPDCINAFLAVSSWAGTSRRSGVWTFYEATEEEKLNAAVEYIKEKGDNELAEVFAKGIHDYSNPKYEEDFDYPESWMDESDEIDDWISEHEEFIKKWEYDLIMSSREILTGE